MKAASFFSSSPNRITKISDYDLAQLVSIGAVAVREPLAVRDLIRDQGAPKIAKYAETIRGLMVKHEEVLIEGIIPTTVQRRAR